MQSNKKKPARELRQEGSYYRCCIPALAGFVSPQSIAPDGGGISSQHRHAQLKNATIWVLRTSQCRVRTAERAVPAFLAERKICLYSRHVCLIDARCFGQSAFALCAFRRQQMASRRMRSQDLATGGDLKAFGDCFARFAACNGLRHTAGKLIRAGAMTNALL